MNQIEKLSPDSILPGLQQRAEELLAIIIEKRKSLANAPAGRLRVAMHGKQWHCYHVTPSTDFNGTYIPKSELKLIRRLAQKEYDNGILKELERELSLIENFMKAYCACSAAQVFEKLHPNRRNFITPVQFSDEEYATRWLAKPYKGKPFLEGDAEYLTSKGERVRSKSEMIIADILAKYNIPYKYECPLSLRTAVATDRNSNADGPVNTQSSEKAGVSLVGESVFVGTLSKGPRLDENLKFPRVVKKGCAPITVYPDFTCLNLRTRKEFLWEHLGRMDDPEYGMKTVRKIRTYRRNGFILGQNLLVTMECDSQPLDRKDVESLVKNFLQ